MTTLGDGTVLPSSLKINNMKSALDLSRHNYRLMPGQVTNMYYPDEEANLSKKSIEYDVIVAESNENGGMNLHNYLRCRAYDLFGGASDFVEYTYRPDDSSATAKPFTNGSFVIILCLNGRTDSGSGIILGGIKHFNNETTRTSEDGHFYDFNFNGIRQFIDKDGAWSITFNSAEALDGTQANEEAAGTTIGIDKDGKVTISDNEQQQLVFDRVAKTITIDNGSEKIIIDKQNKSIEIDTGKNLNANIGEDTTIKAGKAVDLESGTDMTIKSGSDMSVQSGSNINTQAGSNWNVKSGANINIQAGANVIIQGGAQAQLKGTLTMLGDGTFPAAIAGVSQCFGLGNIGAPVISTIITGSGTVLVGG